MDTHAIYWRRTASPKLSAPAAQVFDDGVHDKAMLPDLAALDSMPEVPEMHDRLIALAAKRLDATIVTKDSAMQACKQVKCLW